MNFKKIIVYFFALIFLMLIFSLIVYALVLKVFRRKEKELAKGDSIEIANQMDFYRKINEDLRKENYQLEKMMQEQLFLMDKRIQSYLKESNQLERDNFNEMKTRMLLIDEAQKRMSSVSDDILKLQDILSNKSSRGVLGEIQLKQILSSVYGRNGDLFELEKTLTNKRRVDAVIYAPGDLGMIPIDSKFPLENYERIIASKDPSEREKFEKIFKQDIKKHIKDIANRYLIPFETSDQALMFVPSEQVFSYIYQDHHDLITFAYKNNVWIVSPSTLMISLNSIQKLSLDIEREKYSEDIHRSLLRLSEEFRRLEERYLKSKRHLKSYLTELERFQITYEKIIKEFEKIENIHR